MAGSVRIIHPGRYANLKSGGRFRGKSILIQNLGATIVRVTESASTTDRPLSTEGYRIIEHGEFIATDPASAKVFAICAVGDGRVNVREATPEAMANVGFGGGGGGATTFDQLTDTPAQKGPTNSYVKVKVESGQKKLDYAKPTFKELTDTANSDISRHKGQLVRVSADGLRLEYFPAGSAGQFLVVKDVTSGGSTFAAAQYAAAKFNDLSDTPNDKTGSNNKYVKVNGSNLEYATPSIGEMSDVAETMGTAGQVLKVNSGGTALEYATDQKVTTIGELSDVSNTMGTDGQYLKVTVRGGSKSLTYGNLPAIPSDIGDLSDVADTMGTAGQVLQVTGSGSSKSLAYSDLPSIPSTIGELSDVNATMGSADQYLKVKVTGGNKELVYSDFPSIPSSIGQLSDVASTMGTTGQYLKVTGSGANKSLTYGDLPDPPVIPSIPSAIGDLSDVAAPMGAADQYLKVTGSGRNKSLTYSNLPAIPSAIGDLTDVANTKGSAGQSLRVNSTGAELEYYTPDSVITSFNGLSDTPNDKTGSNGKFVKVSGGNLTYNNITPLDLSLNPSGAKKIVTITPAAHASKTITISGTPASGRMRIRIDRGAGINEKFGTADIRNSDSLDAVATRLAAGINRIVNGYVTASASGQRITITANDEGAAGNNIRYAISTVGGLTLSQQTGTLSGGSGRDTFGVQENKLGALSDVADTMGTAGQVLKVNSAGDALEYAADQKVTTVGELSDVADTMGANGQYPKVGTVNGQPGLVYSGPALEGVKHDFVAIASNTPGQKLYSVNINGGLSSQHVPWSVADTGIVDRTVMFKRPRNNWPLPGQQSRTDNPISAEVTQSIGTGQAASNQTYSALIEKINPTTGEKSSIVTASITTSAAMSANDIAERLKTDINSSGKGFVATATGGNLRVAFDSQHAGNEGNFYTLKVTSPLLSGSPVTRPFSGGADKYSRASAIVIPSGTPSNTWIRFSGQINTYDNAERDLEVVVEEASNIVGDPKTPVEHQLMGRPVIEAKGVTTRTSGVKASKEVTFGPASRASLTLTLRKDNPSNPMPVGVFQLSVTFAGFNRSVSVNLIATDTAISAATKMTAALNALGMAITATRRGSAITITANSGANPGRNARIGVTQMQTGLNLRERAHGISGHPYYAFSTGVLSGVVGITVNDGTNRGTDYLLLLQSDNNTLDKIAEKIAAKIRSITAYRVTATSRGNKINLKAKRPGAEANQYTVSFDMPGLMTATPSPATLSGGADSVSDIKIAPAEFVSRWIKTPRASTATDPLVYRLKVKLSEPLSDADVYNISFRTGRAFRPNTQHPQYNDSSHLMTLENWMYVEILQ